MSIRATLLLFAGALVGLLCGILLVLGLVVQNQRALAAAEARHYDSYKLADELRQSSDDLTRMARTYAVTTDPRYEEYFRRILAIRNGEAPRPTNYGGIYWDFVTATGEKPTPDGDAVALETLMRRMRFADDELAKLREAKTNSDGLVALEDRAMAAVKGLTRDAAGAYTVKGTPDLALARGLLHGPEYHRAKAEIMRPLGQFLAGVEGRTAQELAALRRREARLSSIALGLGGVSVALLLLGIVILQRRVVRPIGRLAEAALRVERGEYGARVQLDGRDEVALLARAFNGMSAAVARDVEERQRVAGQLAASREAAEAASRAKSAFLANMSHELRTPMNAVIGYSEMLAEDLTDRGLEEPLADLAKITSAGKHLLKLISDILDLSKIEAGRMDLFIEPFDVRTMLDEVRTMVAPLLQANGNVLDADLAEDLGTVRADVTKLRQALFNLLSNAAKFTQAGRIRLAARRERIGDQERLTLAVSDTGIGIAADKLEYVFEEFSQSDESTTRNYGGTGLGLTISRRFCRLMGGDLTVQSRLGEGSTFTCWIPTG